MNVAPKQVDIWVDYLQHNIPIRYVLPDPNKPDPIKLETNGPSLKLSLPYINPEDKGRYLSDAPITINYGGSVELNWDSSGANSCTVTGL